MAPWRLRGPKRAQGGIDALGDTDVPGFADDRLAPIYASIGLWAPVLLLFARLIQGISLGGEYGTSATYLSEIATSRHRGFYSSFQYVRLIGGQVFGSVTLLIMQQLFTPPQLEAWGWRVP